MGWGDGGWGGGASPMGFRLGEQTFSLDPSTTGQGGFIYNPGNTDTPYDLTLSPLEAGSKVSEILVAMRSSEGMIGGKYLTDLVNTTSWAKLDATGRGWTVTLENDTGVTDDSANGGVGSGAEVDGASANVGVMLRRVRVTRTTLLDSLRGWERVFLRMRASAVSEWEVQLRWSPSLANPAGKTNTAVRQSIATGTATFQYSELDMGHIMIPEEGALGGMALEIWARRISGSGDLHMNFVRNLPVDLERNMPTTLVVPAGGSETWLGSELVTPTNPAGLTAGSLVPAPFNYLALDAVNEAGGTPPNTGLPWSVGYHRVTFVCSHSTQTSGSYELTFRVRNITDSTNAVVQAETFTGVVSGQYTRTLEFESVAGKSYQAQVVMTAETGAYTANIRSLTHESLSILAQNEQAHTEPDNGIIHKRDSSGNLLGILGHEGSVPLDAPPGLTAVFIIPLDVRKAGYTEGESVKARTVTMTAAGAPRFLG